MNLSKACFVGLIVFFAVGFALPVFAIPAIPHQFVGNVTVNGFPAVNGVIISTKIGNVQNSSTTVVNGKYGYSPNFFFVTDPNGTNNGRQVVFFVNGVQAGQAEFFSGGLTELNLAVSDSTGGPSNPSGSNNSGNQGGGESGSSEGSGNGGNTGSVGVGTAGSGGSSTSGTGCVKTTFDQDGDCVKRDVDCNDLDKNTKQCAQDQSCGLVEGKRRCVGLQNPVPVVEVLPVVEGLAVLPDTGQGRPDFCVNVKCNDNNLCTQDSCNTKNGNCEFVPLANGTVCLNGVCQNGECVQASFAEQENAINSVGFAGLAGTGSILAGIFILVLGIGLGFVFFKQKKKNPL